MLTATRLIPAAILASLLGAGTAEKALAQDDGQKSGTEPFSFTDHFSASTLRPEWSIHNEDPSRWTLLDGEYLLVVSTAKRSNVFALNQTLSRNFELEVHFYAELTYSYAGEVQCVALELGQDEKNWMEHALCNDWVGFTKKQGGESSTVSSKTSKDSGEFGLRIFREGPKYSAYISEAGGAWKKVGDQYFIDFAPNPAFTAYNTHKDVPETGVRFDSFTIQAK